MKKYIIILLIILVGLAIFLALKTDKLRYDSSVLPEEAGGASGQFQKLAADALVVSDQRPGDEVVVSVVSMSEPGFVVVMNDESGKAGKVIGVSEFLVSGIHEKIDAGTTEDILDGVRYYAAVYKDDGNGIFDPKNDKEITVVEFMGDKDASDPRKSEAVY